MNDISFFEISDSFKPNFDKKIAELNKAGAKCGCAAITTVTVRSFRKLWETDKTTGEKTYRQFQMVGVRGGTPKFAGWTLVGTIDPTPNGNMIRKAPSAEGINVSAFYTCKPGCDHCNTVRKRKDTFIVLHDNGDMKQVGRSCIKDFLGHSSPERIGSYFAALSTFTDWVSKEMEDDEERPHYARGEYGYDPVRFLSFVAWSIEKYGYISNAKADEWGKQSTKDDALSAMFPPLRSVRIVPTEDNEKTAKAAIKFVIDFFTAKAPENDFERNLFLTAQLDYFTHRHLGFASYMIAFQKREEEKAQREASLVGARKDKVHVGEVKVRYKKQTLKFMGSFSIDTNYGVLHIQRLEDADRNWLVWKSSVAIEADEGDSVVLDYTVKEHGDYKEVPQTVLTRCKVHEVLPADDSGASVK